MAAGILSFMFMLFLGYLLMLDTFQYEFSDSYIKIIYPARIKKEKRVVEIKKQAIKKITVKMYPGYRGKYPGIEFAYMVGDSLIIHHLIFRNKQFRQQFLNEFTKWTANMDLEIRNID